MDSEIVVSGKIVDTLDGVYEANVGISKGRIGRVSEKEIEGKRRIQLASSQLLFPGFIDPHVHMREPGWDYKEDFLTGSMAALHGGVTTVGDMPNLPDPVTNNKTLLRKIRLARKSLIDVLHIGGVGRNLLGIREIFNLVPAFKIYTAESTGSLTLNGWKQVEEAVKIISGFRKPVTFHCEDQRINDEARERLKNRNYAWKHCDERPRESETSAIEKVIGMCRSYRTKANIAHVSTEEGLKLIKDSGLDVSYEITPHHVLFSKRDMKNSMLKVNPPLRERRDSAALLSELKNGACMLSTDHAPHTLKEKMSESPSGMSGLDTYGNFVIRLMVKHRVKPETLARITSYNASRYFSLNDRARIKEGYVADLVVLDTKGKTRIRNSGMRTKCGWSAFNGMAFPGRVAATIRRGIVY